MDIAATANWPALLGTTSSWAHLLDPLDLNLRRLILRCGDMCQVTYDSFINDKNSTYCGCSRYSKPTLLHKTCFPLADQYDVSGFLYATARVSVPESMLLKSRSREAWDRESNWIGYIAVSNDSVSEKLGRREVYVAWRGTTRDYEWVDILGAKLASVKRLMKDGDEDGDEDEDEDDKEEVMLGWLTMYVSDDPKSEFTKVSARKQLLKKIGKLIEEYKHEKLSIVFTGHSLGASLSVISAFDVVENLTSEIPVSAFVFGCPKVGNKQFNDRLNSHHNLKILHIRNIIDVIPHYPVRVLGYVNTGIELHIDTRKSPYLKDSKNPSDWHNLQTMLHVVNGWNGSNGEFKVRIKRSLALVNKSCDMLKEECLVPASWWVEKNKGMVLKEDGEWVMGELDEENRPSPED
ncbi:Phospholipase A1-IIdelta-like protein [Drosera capensis]